MQRMLVTVAVITLVLASLAVGALAAHWPFWQRAWQWQQAGGQWPARLPGPTLVLRASDSPLPLRAAADSRLAAFAGGVRGTVLVGRIDGGVSWWSDVAFDPDAPVDGRGLATALIPPLLGILERDSAHAMLDEPVSLRLPEWRGDPRGDITARQLLWEMSGLAEQPLVPLNPFSSRAQLASGPDFDRAALSARLAWPPGSHFEPAVTNPQLLSMLVGAIEGGGYARALQRQLWGRIAAHDAIGMLDHPRGSLAAHCCISAAPLDWLRIGLLIAADGVAGDHRMLPEGYVAQMTQASPVHPGRGLGFELIQSGAGTALVVRSAGRWLAISPASGRVVLWLGEGTAPASLEALLSDAAFASSDSRQGG